MRVLVVDDDRDNADSLCTLLTLFGHDARAAYSADNAAQLARGGVLEVAIIDVRMPIADGLHAARVLKKVHPDCHVILYTAGSDISADMVKDAGAACLLAKPLDVDELLAHFPTPRRD